MAAIMRTQPPLSYPEFYLDDGDRQEIAVRRGDYNRLGYAIQLCTVRFLGTFLPEPTAVPRVVIAHLAKQLGIEEPSCLARYRERVETHHTHATEIQCRHGYRDFHQQPEHFFVLSGGSTPGPGSVRSDRSRCST
jgi:TnpA family transposase